MHIADGLIEDPVVLFGSLALGVGSVAIAAGRSGRTEMGEHTALVGVLGAFVFAAQMAKFPLLIGITPVSAHLLGTGLLVALLGPSIAVVTMASVLLIQAFLFQDGGLVAWGANVLALGVGGALPAAALLRALPSRLRDGALAGFLAGTSAVLGSTVVVLGLLIAGTPLDPTVVVVGLGSVQLLAALAEGGITAIVLVAVHAALGPQRIRGGASAHSDDLGSDAGGLP